MQSSKRPRRSMIEMKNQLHPQPSDPGSTAVYFFMKSKLLSPHRINAIVHRMYEFSKRNQDRNVVRREWERANACMKSPIRYKTRGRNKGVSGGVGTYDY